MNTLAYGLSITYLWINIGSYIGNYIGSTGSYTGPCIGIRLGSKFSSIVYLASSYGNSS